MYRTLSGKHLSSYFTHEVHRNWNKWKLHETHTWLIDLGTVAHKHSELLVYTKKKTQNLQQKLLSTAVDIFSRVRFFFCFSYNSYMFFITLLMEHRDENCSDICLRWYDL